jgi:hypothetical protein
VHRRGSGHATGGGRRGERRGGLLQELMGEMTNERFAQLVATGKLITDYADSGDVVDMEALDEDMGVAMKFENEDDDEPESDADEVKVRRASSQRINSECECV